VVRRYLRSEFASRCRDLRLESVLGWTPILVRRLARYNSDTFTKPAIHRRDILESLQGCLRSKVRWEFALIVEAIDQPAHRSFL
jgi:hypothetical protein